MALPRLLKPLINFHSHEAKLVLAKWFGSHAGERLLSSQQKILEEVLPRVE
jgi:hypothetical protein